MPPMYRLSMYPKQVALRDGTRLTLRPMATEDVDALLQFFLRVPEEDRYYLKEDVTSPKVVQRWAQELDYDRALPLLAIVDGRVCADATLHRRRAGARNHVGEVRVVVDPQFRERGLGTTMLYELIAIANDAGLETLVFEAVSGRQDAAVKAAEFLGFSRVAVLSGHARDLDGRIRDVVVLEMRLGRWVQLLPF